MRPGKRQFRELLLPLTVFALLLPLLVGLSVWQYQRGEEKSRRWLEFGQAGGDAIVLAGGDIANRLETLPDWQHVSLQGRFLPQHQVLLDNRPERGQPGWHVLTPFRVAGSDLIILVDRGWLPKQAGEIPDITVADTRRRIEGRLAQLPQPGLQLEGATVPGGWPKPMAFPTVEEVSAELEAAGVEGNVASRILWLAETAMDGFHRDWQPLGLPPERHYAYSFQWAALALTLVFIFVIMLWRWLGNPRRQES